MPKTLIDYLGYMIYFWANDENEAIHVHVSKTPQKNATKFWITAETAELAQDEGSVEKKRYGKNLKSNRKTIIYNWMRYFEHGGTKR